MNPTMAAAAWPLVSPVIFCSAHHISHVKLPHMSSCQLHPSAVAVARACGPVACAGVGQPMTFELVTCDEAMADVHI